MSQLTRPVPPTELPFWTGVARQTDYWRTVARRTWRGTVVSSFVTPVFYVVAMGVLLGGFIEGDPTRLEGASSYLAFVVPGLIAAHAMQTAVGETTYPVMGMLKWQKVYWSMLATPLRASQVVTAHLIFILLRLALTCGVFMLALAPFGLFETWWGAVVAWLSQILVGMCFATLIYGLSTRMREEAGFGLIFRLGVFPLFLFSGPSSPSTTSARLVPLPPG